MTTETTPAAQATEQTTTAPRVEQQQQEERDAESALQAGFNEARGEEPPAEAPAEEKDKTAVTTDVSDDKGTAKEPVASTTSTTAPAPAEDLKFSPELKALIEKVPGLETRISEEIRKVYGKVGELQGLLKQPRKFAGSLKRLKAEFPEIAEMLEQDLTDADAPVAEATADAKGKDAKPGEAVDIEKIVETAIAKTRDVTSKELLTYLHPTWEQDCNTPEFGEFVKSLPEAEQAKYLTSSNAVVAAECFTKFNGWKTAKAEAAKKSQKSGSRKQERLEAAITPSGDGKPPTTAIDDQAAFEQGFKEARQGS
jgi:hypothetical protein